MPSESSISGAVSNHSNTKIAAHKSKHKTEKKKYKTLNALAITAKLGITTHSPKQRIPWTEEEDAKISTYVETFLYNNGHKNGFEDLQIESAKLLHDLNWDDLAARHFYDKSSTSNAGDSPNIRKKRKGNDIKKRWYSYLDPTLRRGRWTPEEDELLLKAYAKHGQHWALIAKDVPRRNLDQCSKRYHEALDPKKSQGRLRPWSEEEDLQLISRIQEYGTKWKSISMGMEGRPSLTCRNRWRKILTSVVRKKASDTITRAVQAAGNINDLSKLSTMTDDSVTPSVENPRKESQKSSHNNDESNNHISRAETAQFHQNMDAISQRTALSPMPSGPNTQRSSMLPPMSNLNDLTNMGQKAFQAPKFPTSPLTLGSPSTLPLLDVLNGVKNSHTGLASIDKAQIMLLDKSPSPDTSMDLHHTLMRSTSNLRSTSNAIPNAQTNQISANNVHESTPHLLQHKSHSGTPAPDDHSDFLNHVSMFIEKNGYQPVRNGFSNPPINTTLQNTNGYYPATALSNERDFSHETLKTGDFSKETSNTHEAQSLKDKTEIRNSPGANTDYSQQHGSLNATLTAGYDNNFFASSVNNKKLDTANYENLSPPSNLHDENVFSYSKPHFQSTNDLPSQSKSQKHSAISPTSSLPAKSIKQTEWKFSLKDKGYTLSSGVISSTELVEQLIEQAKKNGLKISIHQHIHNHYNPGNNTSEFLLNQNKQNHNKSHLLNATSSDGSLNSPNNMRFSNGTQSSSNSNKSPGLRNNIGETGLSNDLFQNTSAYPSNQQPSTTSPNSSSMTTPKVIQDLTEIGHNRFKHFRTLNPTVRPKLGSSHSQTDFQKILHHSTASGSLKKHKRNRNKNLNGIMSSGGEFSSAESSNVSTPGNNQMDSNLQKPSTKRSASKDGHHNFLQHNQGHSINTRGTSPTVNEHQKSDNQNSEQHHSSHNHAAYDQISEPHNFANTVDPPHADAVSQESQHFSHFVVNHSVQPDLPKDDLKEDEFDDDDQFDFFQSLRALQPLSVPNTANLDMMFGSTRLMDTGSTSMTNNANTNKGHSDLANSLASMQGETMHQDTYHKSATEHQEIYGNLYEAPEESDSEQGNAWFFNPS
ncbi:hypothetical protein ACO0QE_000066 [Hanseniaspora vineae]